tara:strand:+ start:238 stop:558 length:321 start_codon:yes stop_codon:yes gene_type:complete
MNTYFSVVNKEHDSAYGLWFPDVEGCFSAADREEDIISNAIEALLLHLEGRRAAISTHTKLPDQKNTTHPSASSTADQSMPPEPQKSENQDITQRSFIRDKAHIGQ